MDDPNKLVASANELSLIETDAVGLKTRSSVLHMSLCRRKKHSIRHSRLNAFLTLRQKDVQVFLNEMNNSSPLGERNNLNSSRRTSSNLFNDSSGIITNEIYRDVDTIAAQRIRSCSFRNALENSRMPGN